MATLAQDQVNVPLSVTAASERVCVALQELGYTLSKDSLPGDFELVFSAKRTLLYTAREGGARITDNGNGSTVELGLDVAPGAASGLMDGKRNRTLIAELIEKISAAAGSA